MIPELEELGAPFSVLALVQNLQHRKCVAVFGSDGLNLCIGAVEEVSGARVQGLVTNINILVFEKARLGVEFRAQLNERVTTLADP